MGRMERVTAVLLMGTLATACGYRLGAGPLPGGVQRLHVRMVSNTTQETGLEGVVTNALITEFVRHGRVSISPQTSADGVLTGRIRSVRLDTVLRAGVHSSLQRRVHLTLSLTLTDTRGQVLWNAARLMESEPFDVVPDDAHLTAAHRRRALTRAAQRLAERVFVDVTRAF